MANLSQTNTNINSLRISSLNVNGLKSSFQSVVDLCNRSDIVFLQETLLLPFDCNLLNHVHVDFYGIGISNTDIDSTMRGRPVGGLAVLWRKSLGNWVRFHPIQTCTFVIGIQLLLPGHQMPWYLLGVYLPTDYGNVESLTAYSEALAALECCITSLDSNKFLCIGDFNAAYTPLCGVNTRFMVELLDVCRSNDWILLDTQTLPPSTFTFLSPAHSSTSWLDHFFVSTSMVNNIFDCEVLYDLTCMDHMPVIVRVGLPVPMQGNCFVSDPGIRYGANWKGASALERDLFGMVVDCDVAKVDWDSLSDVDVIYDTLVNILTKAESSCIPGYHSTQNSNINIPGWNTYVKEHYNLSRAAFLAWRTAGKPRQGPVHAEMVASRKTFKKVFRRCKANVHKIQNEKFGEFLCASNHKTFWNAIHKLSPKTMAPSTIDSVCGSDKITNYWRDFFESRLCTENPGTGSATGGTPTADVNPQFYTSVQEVEKLIKGLDINKSCGPDGVSAHLLKSCPVSVLHLIAGLYNFCLDTGSLPKLLKHGRVVPIVKNKQGDVSSASNYRGICISSQLAKVFELIILRCISPHLVTSSSQFGFKPLHDTTLATFAVENIIEHYNRLGSPVYAAFLDASQAFDNVNHHVLFQLLQNRGVPSCFLRLLEDWYCSGELSVSWEGQTSETFQPSKGVRQGSCLSPQLFNIYIDHLICQIRKLSVGCSISGVPCNVIAYADDLILLSPSFRGLQTLLDVCGSAALPLNIRFNAKKCAFVFFHAFKAASVPPPVRSPLVQGMAIPVFSDFPHLGHILSSDLRQSSDTARARRSFFRMLNLILSRFSYCSTHVKVTLFRAFCLHLYGCELWSRLTTTQKRELEVSLHIAMKRLGGFMRFDHNSVSCMDMGMLTIDRQIAFRQLCFYRSILNTTNGIIQAIVGDRRAFGLSFFHHTRQLCEQFGLVNVSMRDVTNGTLKHFFWCHMERYIISLPDNSA